MKTRLLGLFALVAGVLLGPLATISGADCAAVPASEALEFSELVFIGVPTEKTADIEVFAPGEGERWHFEVSDVVIGDPATTVEVDFDNWYSSVGPVGIEQAVFASNVDGRWESAACVWASPDELREAAVRAGIDLTKPTAVTVEPAPGPPQSTAVAPTTLPDSSPNGGIEVRVGADQERMSPWVWLGVGAVVAAAGVGVLVVRGTRP